jgi:hypothetical protein
MLDKLTPELIASAIVGFVFLLSGLGLYKRTSGGERLAEGAYKVTSPSTDAALQLERIAQALEDIAAQGKDSFQRDMRDKLEKLEEIMEHQAEDKRRRDRN